MVGELGPETTKSDDDGTSNKSRESVMLQVFSTRVCSDRNVLFPTDVDIDVLDRLVRPRIQQCKA